MNIFYWLEMIYYHARIYYFSKLMKEIQTLTCIDMSEERLRERIIEPYINNEEFMLIGRRIDPQRVEAIQIRETEKRLNEIAKESPSDYASVEKVIDAVFVKREIGRNVTHKFMTLPPRVKKEKKKRSENRVFIVHGHDIEPVNELKTILTEFGLEPIVLHEQPSGSKTLVEKLEKYSDVGYAFVILTPDDVLFSRKEVQQLGAKVDAMRLNPKQSEELFLDSFIKTFSKVARQNVILEFGYFMGSLGRERVCCLHKGDVQRPSDMQGIVYIPFQNSVNEARNMIVKELKEAHYRIKE